MNGRNVGTGLLMCVAMLPKVDVAQEPPNDLLAVIAEDQTTLNGCDNAEMVFMPADPLEAYDANGQRTNHLC